jgi:hypothetical protein
MGASMGVHCDIFNIQIQYSEKSKIHLAQALQHTHFTLRQYKLMVDWEKLGGLYLNHNVCQHCEKNHMCFFYHHND